MAGKITLPLSKLRVGIVLPTPIFDGARSDLLLLNKGIRLTQQNLDRLVERGVTSVSVSEEFGRVLSVSAPTVPARGKASANGSHQPVVELPLKELVRKPVQPAYDGATVRALMASHQQNQVQIERFYRQLELPDMASTRVVNDVTAQAMEGLSTDMDLFLRLAINPNAAQSSHHDHCLRLSELAMAMATVSGATRTEVLQLGIGCLISRAGLTAAAVQIMGQPRKLSEPEMHEIRKAPVRMFAMFENDPEIPANALQVAYQMFERHNGTGYPRRRARHQIHPLARIAAVADAYIALTSQRPYRSGFPAYEAIVALLKDTEAGQFDPTCMRLLLQSISLFPIGSLIQLNDGRLGRVMRNHAEFYDRPVVALVTGTDRLVTSSQFLDLCHLKACRIVRTVNDADALQTLRRQTAVPAGVALASR